MIRVYGLTGGTGSGKTAAARRFEQNGIPVIDADKTGHDLIGRNGGAYQQLIETFGPGILVGDDIDRAKLGDLVFADEEARKKLNAIVHPLIFQVISRKCAELARQGYQAAIVDAALLAEHGRREPWLDGLILISAPRDVRAARLVAARVITPEKAKQRIDAQSDPEKKRAVADWVVENIGNLQDLYAKVDKIAGEINAGTT